MKILQEEKDIDRAQQKFETAVRAHQIEIKPSTIGYQGGKFDTSVLWMPTLGIWAHFGLPPDEKSSGERYWNVFGLGVPEGNISIVCEINFPLKGINRRAAGAFIERADGGISVVHRGRFNVAGGMSKKIFQRNYKEEYIKVVDGNREAWVILVGDLFSKGFVENLSLFVKEVDRIKYFVKKMRMG